MNPKNALIRSAKNIIDFNTDLLIDRLVKLQTTGEMKLDKKQLEKLAQLVKGTAQESWARASKDLEKTIDKTVEEVKRKSDPFREEQGR